MPDAQPVIPTTPPRSIIASCVALFRGANAISFADLLIEELERQGWVIVPKPQPETFGEDLE